MHAQDPLNDQFRFINDSHQIDHCADWDWEELRRRCLSEARAILRDGGDPEDATQEALLRAWRFRDRCRSGPARLTWVARIARNETLRQLARRREELLADGVAEAISASGDESDEVADRLVIGAALARLSAEDRRLLRLRYVEDLTQPQVAEWLGIPEGTTKVRLHRLRARLRAELDGTR
jgi:RNA polymerase sigma-70 factor, ECF subfamily